MPEVATRPQLEALLQHPSLWRGGDAAFPAGIPTGHAALDALLPGGGWPQQGLIEILVEGSGHGELALFAPLVQRLSTAPAARWCVLVAPPFEPFAPAWQRRGICLERLLVAHAAEPLWTLEQSLISGACALCFAWVSHAGMTPLRRLSLAAERGAALGVLIRPSAAAATHSPAVLRIALLRTATRLRLQLLKGRGISPRMVELALP